jgi:hypothetical protein
LIFHNDSLVRSQFPTTPLCRYQPVEMYHYPALTYLFLATIGLPLYIETVKNKSAAKRGQHDDAEQQVTHVQVQPGSAPATAGKITPFFFFLNIDRCLWLLFWRSNALSSNSPQKNQGWPLVFLVINNGVIFTVYSL